MIAVVTCWLNHPELIRDYEAVVAGASVVIVDQNSDPDTAVALDAMTRRLGDKGGDCYAVHLPANIHFAAGCNLGADAALAMGADTLVFLNNDIQGVVAVESVWLEQVAKEVKPGGLYGPSVMNFNVDGEEWPYVEGWCLGVSRETWQQLGGFDAEAFPRAYAEDVDLSCRAQMAGLNLYRTSWLIHHLGNRTNATLPGAYDYADQQREVVRNRVRAWREKRRAA